MTNWPLIAWLVLMLILTMLIFAIRLAVKQLRKRGVKDNVEAARLRAAMPKKPIATTPIPPVGRLGDTDSALQDHQRPAATINQSSRSQDMVPTEASTGFTPVVTAHTTEGETVTVSLRTPAFQINSPPQEIDKDAWEEWDADLYGPGQRMRKMAGVNLQIHFTDRNGAQTERNVTSQRYSYNPETHNGVLYAFCHLRQGNRPFALQRIRRATDLATGEIVMDLGAYLDKLYEATPVFLVEQFLDQHDEAAFVLFSFAKADGAMRAKERTIILNWAKAHGLESAEAQAEFETQMRGWYMTNHSFWDAVKAVNKQARPQEYMHALWEAVLGIVASDKKQAGQEELFLRYAAKHWGIQRQDIAIADLPQK